MDTTPPAIPRILPDLLDRNQAALLVMLALSDGYPERVGRDLRVRRLAQGMSPADLIAQLGRKTRLDEHALRLIEDGVLLPTPDNLSCLLASLRSWLTRPVAAATATVTPEESQEVIRTTKTTRKKSRKRHSKKARARRSERPEGPIWLSEAEILELHLHLVGATAIAAIAGVGADQIKSILARTAGALVLPESVGLKEQREIMERLRKVAADRRS